MYRVLIAIGMFLGIALLARMTSAAVAINEVLFDPAGSDTGLESIELHNPDANAADLGGWELYPDGIGYFTFPEGFSLAVGAFALVHLRASGTDDGTNLYHASASSNMGNSSGSLALFRSGGRSKDTIVDFVRYHKPGSSERKTWESTAVEAGLWAVGDFVHVESVAEGNSIGLIQDGDNGSSSSWNIVLSPTLGKQNNAASSPPPSTTPPPSASATATSTPPAAADAGHAPVASLGADAGPDATAIAGAVVEFRGVAFGLDGEPLSGARFLWNFGDGSVKEGKAITHIYHFPGTYHTNMSVSSGELAGSDWRIVRVIPADIRVSEVRSGSDGFVELANMSGETIDLGGTRLSDQNSTVFIVPQNTRVGPRAAIVFPSAITWLDPETRVVLLDARGNELDAMELRGSPGDGGSWELLGDEGRLQPHPAPGTVEFGAMPAIAVATVRDEPAVVHATSAVSGSERPAPVEVLAANIFSSAPAAEFPPDDRVVSPNREMSVLMAGISSGWVYFSASFISSIFIALAAVGMKRWLA